MPRAEKDFSAIYGTEKVTLSLGFSNALAQAPGETLITTTTPTVSPTVTILVASGSDASPSSRLVGSPTIIGQFVVQTIATCQPGTTYNIIATVTTSGGQILTTNAHLPCVHQT